MPQADPDNRITANGNPFASAITKCVTSMQAVQVCAEIGGGAMTNALIESTTDLVSYFRDEVGLDTGDKEKFASKVAEQLNLHRLKFMGRRMSARISGVTGRMQALLISSITVWDTFFAELTEILLNAKPQVIDDSNRNLKFSDLKQLGTIEEARKYPIQTEIDELMRRSHTDQFKFLDKFGIKPLPAAIWTQFIEVTERRNVFVHTSGVVSRQYLDVCKSHGVNTDVEIGDKLDLKPDYLNSACDTLVELAVKLGHSLWRTFDKTDLKLQDGHLVDLTYGLIEDEYYDLACEVLDFALKPPMECSNPGIRMTHVINLAQAHRWAGRVDKCLSALSNVDFTYASEQFRLASLVLQEEYDTAALLMRRIGIDGPIERVDYASWPLFREFRKTKAFTLAFNALFPEVPKSLQSPHVGENDAVPSDRPCPKQHPEGQLLSDKDHDTSL